VKVFSEVFGNFEANSKHGFQVAFAIAYQLDRRANAQIFTDVEAPVALESILCVEAQISLIIRWFTVDRGDTPLITVTAKGMIPGETQESPVFQR
jgi:hypothetical protein